MTTGTGSADEYADLYRDYVFSVPNEIVVDQESEPLVRRALEELHIRVTTRKSSTALGLTLLEFGTLSDNLQTTLEAFVKDSSEGVPGASPRDQVGIVLSAVKRRIAELTDGTSTPTIGRNRLVGHVDGTNGNVIVGNNDPQPAPLDDFPPKAPTTTSQAVQGGEQPRIRVAVIDTAICQHPFLEGKWVAPNPEPFATWYRPSFRAGHGTFVTGIVLGAAPNAAVTVYPALDREGRATSWDIANAILDSACAGAQIINLSLACYTLDGEPPLVFARAISRLPAETLVVAAAGNMANQPAARFNGVLLEFSTAPAWPAALEGANVVAVGADAAANTTTNTAGVPAGFSPNVPWVNVLAPGINVVSILPGGIGADWNALPGGNATWNGTSFATANVTGAVAATAADRNIPPRDAYFALMKEAPPGFTFLRADI